MLHQIEPYKFDPNYQNKKASSFDDFIFINLNKYILFHKEDTTYSLTKIKNLNKIIDFEFISKNSYYGFCFNNSLENLKEEFYILLNIFEHAFFKEHIHLNTNKKEDLKTLIQKMNQKLSPFYLEFREIEILRQFPYKRQALASTTLYHINNFINTRKFCGKCGSKTIFSGTERAISCTTCKHIEYPKINPAIVVAILNDKNQILLTTVRYKNYPSYSLVSGFIEIGETAKEAVEREAFEEVGLKLKNIRPFDSQAWGFSSSLIFAFIAEVDGSDKISFDENELSEAFWCDRENAPSINSHISIGQEMIELFKQNKLF